MRNRHLRFVPVVHHRALAGQPAAAELMAAAFAQLPEPDMPLVPRDAAEFLLQIAAEIEHALLVQYLYAMFSIDSSAPGVPASAARDTFRTAREEMGHLLTVQNALLAVGAAPSLYRENMPTDTDFYPFPFMLEPVSRSSLAKYVLAEMPDGGLSPEKLEQVKADAGVGSGGPINQVGHLYAAIVKFLESADDSIFDATTVALQGDPVDWFADTVEVTRDPVTHQPIGAGPGVFVKTVTSRAEAIDVLRIIALQGEGAEVPGDQSHFKRFLRFYDAAVAAPGPIAFPVPRHPNTSTQPTAEEKQGAITNPVSRLWAQLLNGRYRMLLMAIQQHLVMDGGNGRGDLVMWAFEEMSNIRGISEHLITLDRTVTPSDGKAGPPLEMPYTLLMPPRQVNRWRMQQDLIDDSANLKNQITSSGGDPNHVLDSLSNDAGRRTRIDEIIAQG